MESALSRALAQFDHDISLRSPKATAYRLPIVRIEMSYRKAGRRKNKKTIVNFRGKSLTITEAAQALFEEQGFIVMPTFEVSIFISNFLVAEPPKVRDRYDTLLSWTGYNGYSVAETIELQWRHKRLLRRYCAGNDSVYDELLESAVELATRYYISRRHAKRHVVGKYEFAERTSIEGLFLESAEDIRRKKLFDKKKALFLETLAGKFFRSCLDAREQRAIVDAYRQDPPGSGHPSLLVFDPKKRSWFFIGVKSEKGTLSSQQHDWIEFVYRHFGERALLLRIVPQEGGSFPDLTGVPRLRHRDHTRSAKAAH